MIYYILGIITGIVATSFLIILTFLLKTPIERQIRQTQSQLKEKGKILEPESEELMDWVNSLNKE